MIYLNVGSGKSIREKDIIGIFDMDTSTVSPITRKLLSEADKQKRTETPSYEIPKSFVLYRAENGETRVCFSQFSSASLFGRMGKGNIRQLVKAKIYVLFKKRTKNFLNVFGKLKPRKLCQNRKSQLSENLRFLKKAWQKPLWRFAQRTFSLC